MTVEQKLEQKIKENYKSLRSFAVNNGINYTTVRSVITRGVDNAGVRTIIAICKALDISVDELIKGNIVPNSDIKHKTTINGNNNGIAGMSGDINGGLTINQQPNTETTTNDVTTNQNDDLKIQKKILRRLEDLVDIQVDILQTLQEISKNITVEGTER